MIKKETFSLLTEIKGYWDRFEITQERIDAWYKVLKDYDYDDVVSNLENYVKSNRFAPSVSELIRIDHKDKAIPDSKETAGILKTINDMVEQSKTAKYEAEKERAFKEIRELLGIKRGD